MTTRFPTQSSWLEPDDTASTTPQPSLPRIEPNLIFGYIPIVIHYLFFHCPQNNVWKCEGGGLLFLERVQVRGGMPRHCTSAGCFRFNHVAGHDLQPFFVTFQFADEEVTSTYYLHYLCDWALQPKSWPRLRSVLVEVEAPQRDRAWLHAGRQRPCPSEGWKHSSLPIWRIKQNPPEFELTTKTQNHTVYCHCQ